MLHLNHYRKQETLGFDLGPIHIGGSVGTFLDQASATASQVVPSAQAVLEQTFNSSVHTIESIIQSVANVAGATVGLVSWDQAINSLGETVRSAANTAVVMNPNRYMADFFSKTPLTAHAFHELDKFTGGMITSGTNVSDLVYRAARGDPISKVELARDALFALQAAAIVVGGPGAAGALAGNMIGNEVCKSTQNKSQQDACKITFTIVGAAAGVGIAQAYNTNALISESGADFDEVSYLGSFEENLTPALQNTFNSRVNQAVTQGAVLLCQRNEWAGPNECAILGRIASDYLKAPEGTDWIEFLGREAGNLGVLLLLQDAFPQGSPERNRIKQQLSMPGLPSQKPPKKQTTAPLPNTSTKTGISPLLVGAAIVAGILGIGGD